MNCPENIVAIHLNLQTNLRVIVSYRCDTSSTTSSSYNMQYFLYFMIENDQRTPIYNTQYFGVSSMCYCQNGDPTLFP